MTIQLKIVNKGEVVYVPLDEDGIIIGRSDSSDVTIKDSFLSGSHCKIFIHEGRVVLKDLGSKNGTMLADNKISIGYLQVHQVAKIGNIIMYLDHKKMTPQEVELNSNGLDVSETVQLPWNDASGQDFTSSISFNF